MQLVIMVTARCNAACAHCSTSCGPYRTEKLSRESIERVIAQAAELAEGRALEISITGGEPFLDFRLLRDMVAFGTQRGATMSCVSNGSWATSPARARRLLTELQQAGLRLLAISTSRFHQEYIDPACVERALRAARDIGLECVLKVVRAERDRVIGQAKARRAGAHRVEVIPLMPTLRTGADLPDSDYGRATGLPEGTCPAAILNVAETGKAYMCCTPGAIHDFFVVGHVDDASLREIQDAFYVGAKQQVLRQRGPAHFARAVQARGLGARLRSSYGSVCDLCTHIASDPEMRAIAERTAEAFEQQQREQLFAAASTP